MAQCMKNASGSISIMGSAAGSNIHMSLLKNTLWKRIKALLKSIAAAPTAASGIIRVKAHEILRKPLALSPSDMSQIIKVIADSPPYNIDISEYVFGLIKVIGPAFGKGQIGQIKLTLRKGRQILHNGVIVVHYLFFGEACAFGKAVMPDIHKIYGVADVEKGKTRRRGGKDKQQGAYSPFDIFHMSTSFTVFLRYYTIENRKNKGGKPRLCFYIFDIRLREDFFKNSMFSLWKTVSLLVCILLRYRPRGPFFMAATATLFLKCS